jgi:hypothetical protein
MNSELNNNFVKTATLNQIQDTEDVTTQKEVYLALPLNLRFD